MIPSLNKSFLLKKKKENRKQGQAPFLYVEGGWKDRIIKKSKLESTVRRVGRPQKGD